VLGPDHEGPPPERRVGQRRRAEDGERTPARLAADRDVDDVDVARGDGQRDDETGDEDLCRPLELEEQAVACQDGNTGSVGR
jgi:hypothetical protein